MNRRLWTRASFLVVCLWLCLAQFLSVGIGPDRASAGSAFVVDPAFTSRVKLQNADTLTADSRPPTKRRLEPTVRKDAAARAVVSAQDRIASLKATMEPDGGPENSVTAAQRESLMRLMDAAPDRQAVRVAFDPRNGTPTMMKVKAFTKRDRRGRAASASSTETVARQFLRTHSSLLKLTDPDSEMVLADAWSDAQGGSHYRYQQTINKIPLYGKQLLVHVDGSDSVYLANGRFEPTPRTLSTKPAIEASDALAAVRDHLNKPDLAADTIELVVYGRPEGGMVLAYAVSVAPSFGEGWIYFIDAADAEVVHRISRIHEELAGAGGTDLNGVHQSFNAWHQGSAYYLVDPGMPNTAYDDIDYVSEVQSPGHTYVLTVNNGDGSSLYHVSSSSASSGWDAAGVSVMAHIATVHNFYHATFGRNGLDDNHRNYMAAVHMGHNYANAFWNGTYIVFGDGDNQTFSNLAASLDIAAHELQHGITEFTAKLKYENQSGALNEAYSDVFACMVDDDDWTVGEDCTIPAPGYLRNLAHPEQGLDPLPATMSDYRNLPNTEAGDWGGVHINMSIPSRAGYLMAEGLPSGAIGRAKTAQIWYRALTTYLTPYSQFGDGRNAMVQAAEDLYGAGSAEVAAVEAAWDTVEVYASGDTQPPPPSPTPGDPVAGDDVMIYLYPEDDDHYSLSALLDPGSGYSEDNDIYPLSSANYARYTKSAAYTNSSGNTVIFYVTEDYHLYAATLYADGNYDTGEAVPGETGDFNSIALSPDGRYFAYTTAYEDDNHIYVLDLVEEREGAFAIEPFSDSGDGNDYFNTILRADSLAFDFTSKTLAFDALNCISTEESSCAAGDGYRYWSIGFLQLADDPVDDQAVAASLSFPIPDQSPQFDIGFPAFAANNSYILAVDVLDYADYSGDGDPIDSMVFTLNGSNGESRQVVNPDRSEERLGICGVPTFWGGDDYITIQWYDGDEGSVDRVSIDANFAGPEDSGYIDDGREISSLNDHVAAMPMMHRMVHRSVSGAITLSAQALTFNDTPVDKPASRDLTITNSSGRDIRILDIGLSGGNGQFRHNGSNGLLPRDSQMTIAVTFAPASEGAASASLSITSDADVPTHLVSLSGYTPGSSPGDGDGGGGGGGGGCMIGLLYSELLQQ